MNGRVVKMLDRPPQRDLAPIVKGIPVPKARSRPCKLRDTLAALEVGDSFLWPGTGQVYGYARALGIKITTRPAPGDAGFRIWRTA